MSQQILHAAISQGERRPVRGFDNGDGSSALQVSLGGESGGDVYADTIAHSGSWNAILVLADTVISSITGNVTGLAGPTLKAGLVIPVVFSGITLTSGTIIAYRAHA